ncbi:MAG TPA: ATP-binding protein [Alkalispirochaeta sp.]|nr:ATP-binding protein [Alkalispirochaeta sp.]
MEITQDLTVSLEEETLLDMHSVLNVFNIIVLELMNLSAEIGDSPNLQELHDRTVETADRLRDPEDAAKTVEHVDEFIQEVTAVIHGDVARAGAQHREEIQVILANLESIFTILRVRAREIVARHRDPDAWVHHNVEQLRDNFTSVLQAIERNSHGGYRIVYNVAEHEEQNYLVHFEITTAERSTATMPAIFQDVMRDLLANARKYTPPGGEITAGLYTSHTELRYVVQDTGVGIPADEIGNLWAFGARGSNVGHRATRGGGFGLTKAYYVTRKFGGRMWIDSSTEAPSGTRVEIRIPVP